MAIMNAYNSKYVQEPQYYGYEFIIQGTIERIKKYVEEKNITLGIDEINQIYDFLLPVVDGKVWVTFDNELPEGNKYLKCDINVKAYIIHFAFGINSIDGKFSNMLYVYIDVDYEKKFRLFWEEHYLPTCLLEEAIMKLDLTQQVYIHVFETVYHWRGILNNAKKPVIIGQDINSKEFKKFKPVGFVDGNYLVITSPNDKNDPVGITYNFN